MKINTQKLEMQITAFNEKYKPGDQLNIKMDSGEIKQVTVKCPATILGGHTAVGWFNEISGCYDLSRVVKTKGN
jgi:hypothetical protein